MFAHGEDLEDPPSDRVGDELVRMHHAATVAAPPPAPDGLSPARRAKGYQLTGSALPSS